MLKSTFFLQPKLLEEIRNFNVGEEENNCKLLSNICCIFGNHKYNHKYL